MRVWSANVSSCFQLTSDLDSGFAENVKNRLEHLGRELEEQEDLQLTIDLDSETASLQNEGPQPPHPPGFQDSIHADDSVSNVTADDRVGYESKGESACDDMSLTDDMIEVCDVACQTEFTDSETQSMRSSSQQEKMLNSFESSELRDDIRSLVNFADQDDSTEEFLCGDRKSVV